MSSEKKAVDLGLLEEDDEFEEFPADGEYVKDYNGSCHFVMSGLITRFLLWTQLLWHYILEYCASGAS